jgi:predicted nucleic acid-binding protein
MTYVFDSYAWIEYFSATSAGKKVDEIIKECKDVYTPSIVVAEIKRKLLREMHEQKASFTSGDKIIEFIRLNSFIVDLDSDLAEKAAEITYEMSAERKGFGLADGIVLATANKLDSKIVTGDNHFRGMDNVVFLK